MNKSAIKNFAVSARKKLIEQVMQKAFQIGITAKSITGLKQEAGHIILNNIPQEKSFQLQRDKLIKEIDQKGYDQIMEEVAYTWFNRFIALRFMEVNDYLPTGVRVLSSLDPNRAEPDIIREALNVDLAVDRNTIYGFQDKNDSEGLFKYLLIRQCNDLNKILSFMFETISDYTELLFPSNLLQEGSVIRDLVTSIPEEDWKEVEIIGWLYQYYISEKKDEVFADLKKNKKITKENIPAATQLFTPKWIVQYMVENSLGRLWLESHPNGELKAQWKYYLEEAEQEPEVQKQLEALKNPELNPLTIKALDPCCGSGHILVYAFEVLYEIYKSYGYMEDEIPKLILENNLYGLDIDDRAAQLASFAVMMKARSKSRGVFRENIKLNICAIQESNWMGNEVREILVDREAWELEQSRERDIITYLADTFKDAKEFGSILDVRELDLEFLEQRLYELENSVARDLLEVPYRNVIIEKLPGVVLQTKIMAGKYDVVCTNPPYVGRNSMNPRLINYLDKNYANSKNDLFAVFMEKCSYYCTQVGYFSMITQHSWMFLSSYEKLRQELMLKDFINMAHLGARAFEEIGGEVVQTIAFVFRNGTVTSYKATYVRLIECENQQLKELGYLNGKNRYMVQKKHFSKIPGTPIAYWVSDKAIANFNNETCIETVSETRIGMATANNDLFMRFWFEINNRNVNLTAESCEEAINSGCKWFAYCKGGAYRKWYGNLEYVVNWENDGFEIRNFRDEVTGRVRSHNYNLDYIFRPGLTYTAISSSKFACRIMDKSLFGSGGSGICKISNENKLPLLSFLNSNVAEYLLSILSSTMNFEVNIVGKIPFILNEMNEDISDIVRLIIDISKTDWDNFETSWNFRRHPLIDTSLINDNKSECVYIQDSFNIWKGWTDGQFYKLREKEEELNRIFIDIYGLQDELTPEVEDKDITVRKADQSRDIKSFISYAVGCMLGRYSLDEEGLIFAGGKFDPERYKIFKADADGILPVLSDAYFDDDIVTQFVEFMKVTFGENTLATNLDYIAETLGRKANESSRECIRRYFLKDFYKDHVQMYKKRPIYWLFTSGKEQGFNALVYMHRYDSSMVSRVRTDYLHPLQNKLEAEFQRLNQVMVSEDSPTEKTKATKRLKVLSKQMEELKKYDEVIHNLADQQIEIDLDDGVVVNYAKFEKVLAKI